MKLKFETMKVQDVNTNDVKLNLLIYGTILVLIMVFGSMIAERSYLKESKVITTQLKAQYALNTLQKL